MSESFANDLGRRSMLVLPLLVQTPFVLRREGNAQCLADSTHIMMSISGHERGREREGES